jgi:hypothetical protein
VGGFDDQVLKRSVRQRNLVSTAVESRYFRAYLGAPAQAFSVTLLSLEPLKFT